MDGIILIDKEKGYTSRDVVNIISKKLNTKKVGHFGTLDPLATGLLVIGVGKYTKAQVLFNEKKKYEVEILLGKKYDTYDIPGNLIEEEKINEVDFEKLKDIILSFKKSYLQEVPIYSAVKVNGKKLYEYARNNISLKENLPKKEVSIFSIDNISLIKKDDDFYITFDTLVSKGTYIRSLINDISKKSNISMTMSNLRRTNIDLFDVSNKDVLNVKDDLFFIDIDKYIDYKRVEIPSLLEKKIMNGNKIDNIFEEERIVFTKNNKNIVLYEKDNFVMRPIFFF